MHRPERDLPEVVTAPEERDGGSFPSVVEEELYRCVTALVKCDNALDPCADTRDAEFGITLLVIEHNMRVIMNLARNIYCLAHGELLASGTPEEIQKDQRVIDAYLGAH